MPSDGSMTIDADELSGLRFACLPGCGFCCSTSPALVEEEPEKFRADPRLAVAVVKAHSTPSRFALALSGCACTFLGPDRACTIYADRPHTCRVFPFHLHAGERLQVYANRSCPGVWIPAREGDDAQKLGIETARRALSPAARAECARASENFREFARRARELGVEARPPRLREAFSSRLDALLDPNTLASLASAIEGGRLALADIDDAYAVEARQEPETVLGEVAAEIFPATPEVALPQEVDREFRWLRTTFEKGAFATVELAPRGTTGARGAPVAFEDLDFTLPATARGELAEYLSVVNARDATYGHAARIVDAVGYRVEPAAAYGRVLADCAAGLIVRYALAKDARRAIAAEDMHRLSQPTIGAVL